MASRSVEEQAVEATVTRRNAYYGVLACPRCSGLMMSESYFESIMQRCIQCGERVDAVILENRQKNGDASSTVCA
jgi:hypothetical protein